MLPQTYMDQYVYNFIQIYNGSGNKITGDCNFGGSNEKKKMYNNCLVIWNGLICNGECVKQELQHKQI